MSSALQLLTFLSATSGLAILAAAPALWLAYPWLDERPMQWEKDGVPSVHLLHRIHLGLAYGAIALIVLHLRFHCRLWLPGRKSAK